MVVIIAMECAYLAPSPDKYTILIQTMSGNRSKWHKAFKIKFAGAYFTLAISVKHIVDWLHQQQSTRRGVFAVMSRSTRLQQVCCTLNVVYIESVRVDEYSEIRSKAIVLTCRSKILP